MKHNFDTVLDRVVRWTPRWSKQIKIEGNNDHCSIAELVKVAGLKLYRTMARSFKGSPRNSPDHRETIKRPSCRGNNPEVVESIVKARRSCQIGKRLWANELDFSAIAAPSN